MSTEKNKGGRPQRVPGEKLRRVNLSLKPKLLFGIELVARDRRTSLSQAAEYLIEQQLRDYAVGEANASQFLEEMTGRIAPYLKSMSSLGVKVPADFESIASALLGAEAGRAFFMPAALQLPVEKYFREMWAEMLRVAISESEAGTTNAQEALLFVTTSLTTPERLDALFDYAKSAEVEGKSIKEAAREVYAAVLPS